MKDLEEAAEELVMTFYRSLIKSIPRRTTLIQESTKCAILCVEKQIETLKEFYDHAFDEAMPDKNRFLAEKQQLLTILKNKP